MFETPKFFRGEEDAYPLTRIQAKFVRGGDLTSALEALCDLVVSQYQSSGQELTEAAIDGVVLPAVIHLGIQLGLNKIHIGPHKGKLLGPRFRLGDPEPEESREHAALEFERRLDRKMASLKADVLDRHADEITPPTTQPVKPKRKRKPSTLGNLHAVKKAEQYRQAKGLTHTEFARLIDTTDRTLRSFYATGQLRADLFAALAKVMGTTKESLLAAE